MSDVIIFGGTTEGRKLASFCAQHQIRTVVCVVSEYGEMLVPESSWVKVLQKALDMQEMEELFRREQPALVLDATHPYARVVTENLRQVCESMKIKLLRVLREPELEMEDAHTEAETKVVSVNSVEEAVAWLQGHEGRVLVTTGSKELVKYTALPDFQERIFPRILPDSQALANSEALGFPRSHMIAMQGPFSMEMNLATLHMTGAKYLVTKESGHVGGFLDKIHAAGAAGVTAIVIGRPLKETGISLKEACASLLPFGTRAVRTITLAGIGMGAEEFWTIAARQALSEADAVAGAARMIESIGNLVKDKTVCKTYDGTKILDWFEQNPQLQNLVVLYSGDTGFYSGASGLVETLKMRQKEGKDLEIKLEVLPGISTVSYLASRFQIPWQNLELESLHGRDAKPWEALERGKDVFLLLGGADPVPELSRKLTEHKFGKWMVLAGRNLSYPDEELLIRPAEEMADLSLKDGLWAVIIRRPDAMQM